MKYITTTIIAAAAFATTSQAMLDTKSFSLVEAWAQKQGYSYDGIARRFDAHVFVNKAGVIVFAPVSSDTADEAINALIASRVTNAFHAETAKDKPVAGAPGQPKEIDVSGKPPEQRDSADVYMNQVATEMANHPEKYPEQEEEPGVPNKVLAQIKRKAASDYPGDYWMQKNSIRMDIEAYIEIH